MILAVYLSLNLFLFVCLYISLCIMYLTVVTCEKMDSGGVFYVQYLRSSS